MAKKKDQQTIKQFRRGHQSDFDGYLDEHDDTTQQNSRVIKTRIIKLNSFNLPKIDVLSEFLASLATDYTKSRKEIAKAMQKNRKFRSTSATDLLAQEAKKEFSTSTRSGELGEILTYALIERYLGMPQIVSKMSLKTARMNHFHGADGIHFDISNGRHILVIGESKVHKRVNAGIQECLRSINKMLMIEQGTSRAPKVEKEFQLIRSHLDLNDVKTEEYLRRFFDQSAKESSDLEIMAVGLIMFNCSKYPNKARRISFSDVKKEVNTEMIKWHQKLNDVAKNMKNLKKMEMIFFLIPVPDVQKFREKFVRDLGS